MSAPSEAEIQTQWKQAVDILEEWRKFGQVNAKNFITMWDTAVQSLEGDFVQSALDSLGSIRNTLASGLTSQVVATVITPYLRMYARHVMNTPELVDPIEILSRLYIYFADNAKTVQTTTMTFNTPAAGGGNVGNGTVLRVTTDQRNFPIESADAELKTAKCIADANTGAQKQEEVFQFYGAAPGRDSLEYSGSGEVVQIANSSARDSLLLNPSFSQISGTITVPTDITSWVSSVTVNATNYQFSEATFYRDFPGDSTPRALQIKVTANLTQKLSVRRTVLDPNTPYMLQLAWNRDAGAATGTLLIRMGAQSNSVVLAAQTGWNILRTPSSFGQNNWYRQFDEQDLDITIEWTQTGGTGVFVDDVLFIPGRRFGNTYYFLVPNASAHAPNLKDDIFTWTDTETGAKVQRYLKRGFGAYLPSSGGPTFTDP